MKKKKVKFSADWNREFWSLTPSLFINNSKQEKSFGLLFLNFGIGILINKTKKKSNGKTNDNHN